MKKETILIFVMLSFFVLDSNAQKRKYYPPFMEGLNVKLQKFWDERRLDLLYIRR